MSETALTGNRATRFLNREGMVKNHHVKLILHWSRLEWKKPKEYAWTSPANCTTSRGAVTRVFKSRSEGRWRHSACWSNMSTAGVHCLVERWWSRFKGSQVIPIFRVLVHVVSSAASCNKNKRLVSRGSRTVRCGSVQALSASPTIQRRNVRKLINLKGCLRKRLYPGT